MSIEFVSSPALPAAVDPSLEPQRVDRATFGEPEWAPIAAFGSAAQERLSVELVRVLHNWIVRSRPGMWHNFRGEAYPVAPAAEGLASPRSRRRG